MYNVYIVQFHAPIPLPAVALTKRTRIYPARKVNQPYKGFSKQPKQMQIKHINVIVM